MFGGLFSSGPKIEDTLFNIRMTGKQLERMSSKAEKKAEEAKKKMGQALKKGSPQGAAIFAETVIQQRNQANQYLRMAARLDGVRSKIQATLTMQNVAKDIGSVCKSMDKAMAKMDLTAMMTIMDDFESLDETIGAKTEVMTNSLDNAAATTVSGDDVADLLKQMESEVATEAGAAAADAAAGDLVPTAAEPVGVSGVSTAQEDALQRRLAALRAA
mmetsp:Transcript_31141/g.81633  ORF Transcript_31141/g.81633 Transcript_31141/m.81633 type:complete len:216 (+) Transcript_31141:189-836(+)|eukprot:CAMPEP_0182925760 /NCGR_PEP_ID=MMETSP0105_2-20130417/10446_1 /TAXON_ID=81532 ORGANISM="Acanthoeca-like sp., Strain 10tr" /NCGR_SAMPLE_ID=MMETSP0105_2 /ASSEMBLY_ACC=CAM_ASM_000205 /LENGTH=215 /DNA_ID=CAMNT_0025063619 /DNA_START=172 /DNA_END=819 /DNA_ORIENTATION=+